MIKNEIKIGIDALSFFVPNYFVDMTDLALDRKQEPAKFHIGIGQDQMAVNPASQDIVTFASNAASQILTEADKKLVDTVIVATESSFDESKASAVIVHDLLGIQPFARSIELKEACYGATAGLTLARDHVASHPEAKVLVIAADIARYGLNSAGEVTQGAGSVAMLVTANPRILALNDDNVAISQDLYDFWRPMGESYPTVDGKFSNQVYIESFAKVWDEYVRQTGHTFSDFKALAFHTPYTKMGKKALLPKLENESEAVHDNLLDQYEKAITYSRRVGNLYTGSLYLSLISLLENSENLVAGDQIGLFSYGSGSVAEFFSSQLVDGFEKQLNKTAHQALLDSRQRLSIAEYEKMFQQNLDMNQNYKLNDDLTFSVSEVVNHHRLYKR